MIAREMKSNQNQNQNENQTVTRIRIPVKAIVDNKHAHRHFYRNNRTQNQKNINTVFFTSFNGLSVGAHYFVLQKGGCNPACMMERSLGPLVVNTGVPCALHAAVRLASRDLQYTVRQQMPRNSPSIWLMDALIGRYSSFCGSIPPNSSRGDKK